MNTIPIKKFEDIIAWQKSKAFVVSMYFLFFGCKDYSFRDQIQRAAISIMNNMAEGFERQTNKEFKNFLYITKGSCAETRSMIQLAEELKYLSKKECEQLFEKAVEISKILSGLIKTL